MSQTDADRDLVPENYAELNERFYEAEPWRYFQQRLAHLVHAASASDSYRALFADGISVGSLTLGFAPEQSPTSSLATPEQSFVAIETEVLLHHVAETLLRFAHAHADRDEACPWMRLSRMTSHTKFKHWVKAAVLEDRADAVELCCRVFPCHPDHPEVLDTLADYLNLLARHFLDADSYNAAKHGMAISGASEQWSVAIDEVELLRRSGATVSWLARWPRDDPERPARWTQASRSFSVEACVALIYSTSLLMRGLWLQARHRWLGAELTESVRPWPPSERSLALIFNTP